MEDIELFINWLKTKEIYGVYINTWETEYDLSFFYFKDWVHDQEILIPNLIISAFTWSDTEEGQDFWEQYHYEWKCYYKNQTNYPNISIY